MRIGQSMVLRTLAVVCCCVVVLGAFGCGKDNPVGPTDPITPPDPTTNRNPTASGSIPDQRLTVQGSAVSVNVAQYFTDPDGDTLTYSATSSNAGVATGSVAGSTVTLTPVGVGTATITVTARDPGGLTATQSIAVTVASGPSSDDHGNMPATATFIGANSSTAGTLEQGGDVDYFRFVVSARTTLTVESTGNTDTVGQLEASDGSVLASNDDGAGSGVNFRIREEVSAGTYYIQVSGFLNDVGPYTLVVSSAGGTPSEIPDLVVESPAVSSGAVAPDESFTLSATVRNQGAGAAGSTTLRYYRSSNTRISTSDTEIGTDGVPALAGNRTSSLSTSLRAPNSAGTYYYGACVDAVGGESDTGNNCSIGVRVVVSSSSDDHGDTRATATPIGSNSSTPGTLDRGDIDYFRLVLSARTTLTAESTGNTDTVGRLDGQQRLGTSKQRRWRRQRGRISEFAKRYRPARITSRSAATQTLPARIRSWCRAPGPLLRFRIWSSSLRRSAAARWPPTSPSRCRRPSATRAPAPPGRPLCATTNRGTPRLPPATRGSAPMRCRR